MSETLTVDPYCCNPYVWGRPIVDFSPVVIKNPKQFSVIHIHCSQPLFIIVCVCVCVCKRERLYVCMYLCVCVCV